MAYRVFSVVSGACSNNTGAYCRAWGRLRQKVMGQLTIDLADGCENQLDKECLWRGRHVYLVDGTPVSMPHTAENQEVYSQQSKQLEGLGFPVGRAVSLGSGDG